MPNVSSCFEQSYNFNNSFFFHEKKGSVQVAIYDLSSKLIYSSPLSNDMIKDIDDNVDNENDLKGKVTNLLNLGYKPYFDEIGKKIFLHNPSEGTAENKPDYKNIDRTIERAISLIEPKVSFEPDECSHFTDPINHTLFKNPVVDHHGHSFEEESILNWLKVNAVCPLEGKPLQAKNLKPNIALRNVMEDLRRTKFSVPTLDLYKGRKEEKFSQGLLEQALMFEKEGNFDEALDLYRKALTYTNESKHYRNIPMILEKKAEHLSACLAYLYLAKYQLREGSFEPALESLIKARNLQPDIIELDKPIALFYKEIGNDKEAFSLYNKMGDRFVASNDEMSSIAAIEAYQKAIEINPDIYEVYSKLANEFKDNQRKANILLLAANHFMKKNTVLAERFCLEAYELCPNNPLSFFPYIHLLKKENKIYVLVETYLELSAVYKDKKDKKNKLLCLREVVKLNPSEMLYGRITMNYLKLNNNKRSLEYFLKWIDHCISEKKWNAAETIAQRALETFDENVDVLKRLEKVYSNFLNEHLHTSLLRLAKAYVLNDKLDLAKETYQKAWKDFSDGKAGLEVVNILYLQKNETEAIRVLFELSKEVFYKNEMSILHKCIRKILEIDPFLTFFKDEDKLTFLMLLHIEKQESQISELTKRVGFNECKDLYKSCAIGDINHLETMVQKLQDPEAIQDVVEMPNEDGLNLLQIAVLNNQENIAHYLVSALNAKVAINVNPKLKHECAGLSLIEIAAKKGNNSLITLLVGDRSIVTPDNPKTTPLHLAVKNGFFETTRLLLSYNSSINEQLHRSMMTALHVAVSQRHLGITKLLLCSNDSDPNLADKNGHTPLYHAVKDELPDFVRIICESGKVKLSANAIDELHVANKENLKASNVESIKEIEEILLALNDAQIKTLKQEISVID